MLLYQYLLLYDPLYTLFGEGIPVIFQMSSLVFGYIRRRQKKQIKRIDQGSGTGQTRLLDSVVSSSKDSEYSNNELLTMPTGDQARITEKSSLKKKFSQNTAAADKSSSNETFFDPPIADMLS